jgi:hypothetical protein
MSFAKDAGRNLLDKAMHFGRPVVGTPFRAKLANELGC